MQSALHVHGYFVLPDQQPMLVAYLWNRSLAPDDFPELLSFAAITDGPLPDMDIAGQDRCIIQIKPELLTR